jgi:hypothetical protein
VNRERTRKDAKFERQEEMFLLTDFAFFRVISRFTQNVEASQGAGISMPANGCGVSENARAGLAGLPSGGWQKSSGSCPGSDGHQAGIEGPFRPV